MNGTHLSYNSVHIQPSLRSELGHLQRCDEGFIVMSHSNQSKDFEKALNRLKSFGAIILLLMDSDNPSSPSFLGFVVEN